MDKGTIVDKGTITWKLLRDDLEELKKLRERYRGRDSLTERSE
jgi:hypothetical protein